MGRFQPSLMKKVNEERKDENKQRALKEQSGIVDDDIYLKEKGVKDYFISFVKNLLYIIFVLLIFIGVVAVLNPVTNALFFEKFKILFP